MSGKRILIDARCLHTGIGTYLMGVLNGAPEHKNGWTVHAVAQARNAEHLRSLCDEVRVLDVPIYSFREQWALSRAGRGYDLLHVPHYNAPLTHRGRMLVSILDLVHIMDPTFRRMPQSWLYARPMFHAVARKATHIVTLSEFSKRNIVELLHVSPEKVTVVHCGVGPQYRVQEKSAAQEVAAVAAGIHGPYVLYVGNLKPHKNVGILLQAFAKLKNGAGIPHRLVIVGDDVRWKGQLVEQSVRLGVTESTRFISHVGADVLPCVYAGADVLVLPSTLEGFGLPVVEAMACGTPVACSRSASMPEVGGDAVEYFDPSSAEDVAAAIRRILDSTSHRESLRQKGVERAKQFDWKECSRRHFEVYGRLLAN